MQSKASSDVHIFDCDGVILDSNRLKLEALRSALETVSCPPAFVDWAIKEFRVNFGRTRVEHFDVFTLYNEISEISCCSQAKCSM